MGLYLYTKLSPTHFIHWLWLLKREKTLWWGNSN